MMPGIVARRRRVTPPVGVAVPASALNHFDANLTTDDVAGNVWGTHASAALSAVSPKFGPGCLSLPGSAQYAVVEPVDGLAEGADDFTVAVWMYIAGSISGVTPVVIAQATSAASSVSGIQGRIDPIGSNLEFLTVDLGCPVVPTDEWVHIAITRAGGTVRGFVNATVGTSPMTSNTTDLSAGGARAALGLYRQGGGATGLFFDEYLYVRGQALWTDSFTLPEAPYELAA